MEEAKPKKHTANMDKREAEKQRTEERKKKTKTERCRASFLPTVFLARPCRRKDQMRVFLHFFFSFESQISQHLCVAVGGSVSNSSCVTDGAPRNPDGWKSRSRLVAGGRETTATGATLRECEGQLHNVKASAAAQPKRRCGGFLAPHFLPRKHTAALLHICNIVSFGREVIDSCSK